MTGRDFAVDWTGNDDPEIVTLAEYNRRHHCDHVDPTGEILRRAAKTLTEAKQFVLAHCAQEVEHWRAVAANARKLRATDFTANDQEGS